MITRHGHEDVVWVDLEAPTRDELSGIMREFSIDPRVEEEMIAPTPYPVYAVFPEYAYIILHFPSPGLHGETKDQEVDLIVGKRFVITCRYETIDPLHNLHKIFEAEELLGTVPKEGHADAILVRLMGKFYKAMRDQIEHAGRTLSRVEREIFNEQEHSMVRALSEVGRQLLHYERVLDHEEETLTSFLDALNRRHFFGESFPETRDTILLEHKRTVHLVESYRAVVMELRDTNNSLLTAKQNNIMKKLTIITFTMLPLTLIASLFQMNATHTPIIGMPGDFWIILAIMVLCSAFIGLFVLRKRWL